MMKIVKNVFMLAKRLWNKLTDPSRPLEREYRTLLLEARNLQRSGDIPAYARKIRESEEIRKKIDEIKK